MDLPKPTEPRISDAQNSEDMRRLVAAQARIYSDAKRLFYGRIWIIVALSVLAMITTATWPASRLVIGGGGGLLIFAGSFVAESVEKRKRLQAAAIQELFDTRLFGLDWNPLNASRPTAITIARAADRYRGGRDANWYEDARGVHRPFDILICQATNLGWGATMHRLWAWIVVGVVTASVIAVGALWAIAQLPFEAALLTFLIPALAPLKELIQLARSNFENANTKEAAERTLNELWERGLSRTEIPSEYHLRSLQDKILTLRQTNAFVPDWLDTIFHQRNEAATRASVDDRVLQAARHGHASFALE